MADQTATDAADWMQQRKEQLDRNRAEGRGEVPDEVDPQADADALHRKKVPTHLKTSPR